MSDLCVSSFWLDLTFSILWEAGAFQEAWLPCRLPISLAGYFIIAETGRDCDWLICIYDKICGITKVFHAWGNWTEKQASVMLFLLLRTGVCLLPDFEKLTVERHCLVLKELPLTIAFVHWSSGIASSSLICESQEWKGKAQRFSPPQLCLQCSPLPHLPDRSKAVRRQA